MPYHVGTFDAVNGGYIPQVDGNNNAVVYATVALATAAGFSLDNGATKSFAIWDATQLAYETPEVVVSGQFVA